MKDLAKYIDAKELLEEIKLSKDRDDLTPRALDMLLKMVKEINRTMRYKNSMDREDCKSRAAEDIWRYWRGFDPAHPKANVFSYFTRMIKFGCAKGYNELHPETKLKITMVSINSDEGAGVYNI